MAHSVVGSGMMRISKMNPVLPPTSEIGMSLLRKTLLVVLLFTSAQVKAAEPPVCCAADRFFAEQVWLASVSERA